MGQNHFQRPTPSNGPPMQRPLGGSSGPPPTGQPGAPFGQPARQAPPGNPSAPFLRPPPQHLPMQQPQGLAPPSSQVRPGPPSSSTAGPAPQRPPQQFSLPPRPFSPGPPSNFRPPVWGLPPRGGPPLQQGPPPAFAPGGRPPMQWPPGHPGMVRPGGFPASGPRLQGASTGVNSVQGGPGELNSTQGGAGSPAGQKAEAGKDEGKKEMGTESEEVRKAWSAHKNDEGVAYYYNSVTGESTYEKPKGFVGEEVDIIPVAWERIDGTDWHLVTTNLDSKYYYNTTTQETSWQVPAAVAEQRQKKAEEASVPDRANGESAVGTIKKKLHEEDAIAEVGKETPPEKDGKDEEGNGAEQKQSEKEKLAADFKEMLKEKKVPPFAKWDKELPKIFADPRFKAIATTAERRALFDRYVKTRAEEERLEKREALRAAMNGFRELLDEVAEELDHTVTYADFETMKGDDPRFKALEKKERETLLNERIAPLRKAEEERLRKEREAAVTAFHELLAEKGANETTKWATLKEEVREDPRYKAVARNEREQVFNDFLAKWKGGKESEVEEKLKAHEREARKRKEREEEELERIRTKARQKDALDSYKAILAQKVKEADATWADWRRRIEKEAEEKQVTPHLEAKELEHLFKEHVRGIMDACVRDYKRLLAEALPEETIQKEDPDGRIPLDSWTAAKGLMREDARLKRLPKVEREPLYRQYTEDVRKRLNLPPGANYVRDRGPAGARPPAAEPRRETYREHRDKRPRR
ncbi:Pre-mRNA-processing protein [Klebsormidium nitens]|uniref:Pre-mRNA-processing protein n=1 Tax=Klebsormidium nitens TaxID=105231 RepID=A0A1Y1I5X7_KLENI|nr:Pre-mRNA-processing protein [Klebsormidium nitens]|eukprot:GAQ86364.1 Pre-mRNA-processing protein [Klebsormidium nitens]